MKAATSLQEIQDNYINLGYRGEKLKMILSQNKKYQPLLQKKKQKVLSSWNATAVDKKKYVLSTNDDYIILDWCKKLEKKKLFLQDKIIVRLVKTQLEQDWRLSLRKELKKLIQKYKLSP